MTYQEPMLAERAEAFMHVCGGWFTRRNPPDFLGELFGPPPGIFVIDERTQHQTRQEVRQQALRLQNLINFLPSYLRLIASNPSPLHVSTLVDENFVMWITSRRSHFLWTESQTNKSVNLLILPRMGIRVCGYAYEAGLPVAIFSMHGLPNMESRSSVSEKLSPMVDLTYSLIRQLITHLPERFERPGTLSSWHFQRLDGSLASLGLAIDMLASLLEYIPPFLVCVIDGIDKLENDETIPHLNVLLNTLRALSRGRRFKFWFTTSGPSQVLSEKLNEAEHLNNVFSQIAT